MRRGLVTICGCSVCDHCSHVSITWRDPAERSVQGSLLHPPCLTPHSLLLALSPCDTNNAPTIFSHSSPSSDSCHLLTSRTRTQRRESGQGLTGVCLSVNGAFFLSLSFSLPRQSCVLKSQHPLLTFPVAQTAVECRERHAIYRWVDMRTREEAQT